MVELRDDWLDTFGTLGLNTNEIKILMFLYQIQGAEKADIISEETGVPLTRTYEALDSLTNMNFVIRHEGRPRKYEAENPQVAISEFVEREEQAMHEKLQTTRKIANETLEIAQNIYISNHTQIEPDELLEQFSSLEDAESQTIQLIQDAEQEILIFSHVFQWYYKIKQYLLDAVERGCTVRVLMQTEDIDPQTAKDDINPIDVEELENNGIEVKNIPALEIMTRGTLVDRKYVVFVIWVDPEESKERRIYRPQFSSNQGIVDVFYGYFSSLWDS